METCFVAACYNSSRFPVNIPRSAGEGRGFFFFLSLLTCSLSPNPSSYNIPVKKTYALFWLPNEIEGQAVTETLTVSKGFRQAKSLNKKKLASFRIDDIQEMKCNSSASDKLIKRGNGFHSNHWNFFSS